MVITDRLRSGSVLGESLRFAHAVRICAHGAYLVFAGVKIEGKLMLLIVRMLQTEMELQLEVNMWFNYGTSRTLQGLD
jgi:hypothetical protein